MYPLGSVIVGVKKVYLQVALSQTSEMIKLWQDIIWVCSIFIISPNTAESKYNDAVKTEIKFEHGWIYTI